MTVSNVLENCSTQQACLSHLQKLRWGNTPACPYCQSTRNSVLASEDRFHCNTCNTSFSVTVGTIFHHTHLPLQKWFLATTLLLKTDPNISVVDLSKRLQVNKNTASRIRKKVLEGSILQPRLLAKLAGIND